MKFTYYLPVALILWAFTMSSCGSKKVSPSDANSSIIDSNKKQDLFVWVENARIRNQPDLNAEVVAEVAGGNKVTLTGEESSNKIKVKLRGVEFEDVWAKVITVDQKEGWIFKGMLTDDSEKALAMNDFAIVPEKSVGRIKIGDRKEDVEKIFGTSFIQDGDIFFPEGMTAKGFYIFKDSPLELQCVTNEKTGTIDNIMIRQPSSNWSTSDGIKIGMKLDDLARINGKPITFSGFGWDYGGFILSFNNGKLSQFDAGMTLSLGEPDNLDGLEEFMGDVECSTANKKILGKGVKVVEISIFGGPAI